MKIAIIKYGMGNVASVQKALKKLGYESVITKNPKEIHEADFIILPGVGSFEKGMDNLQKSGLTNLLRREVVDNKKPFLGICLGMQLLATYGNEPLKVQGLDFVKGEVVKMDLGKKYRIPHLGWNDVQVGQKSTTLFKEFNGCDYYFIHGYNFLAKHEKDIALTVKYGKSIVAALHRNNIYGVQFHPEKSQEAGMRLLKRIIDNYA